MENHEIKKVLTFIKATIKTHGSSGLDFAIKQSLGRSLPQDDFAQVVYYLRNQGKLIVDNFDGVGWVASPQGFLKRNPFLEKVLIAVISGGISLGVGLTISKQSKQSQTLIDKQQDSLIQGVSESVSNLEKRIKVLE